MVAQIITSIQDLKQSAGRWVLWRRVKSEPADKKIPYTLDGETFKGQKLVPGVEGSGTFKEAYRAWKRLRETDRSFAGIGVILGEGLGGIDFDEVRDASSGDLHPEVLNFISNAGTYTEISPSKTGLKALYSYTEDDLQHIPKTIYLAERRAGERVPQIDPTFREGRFYTFTGRSLHGLVPHLPKANIRPIRYKLKTLAKLAKSYGAGAGRARKGQSDPEEGTTWNEDPPHWFKHEWQDDLPDSLQLLADHDEVFHRLWTEGEKPDKGGDSSGSGLDWSLIQYLGDRIPAGDLPTALAHFPHGQVSQWIMDGEDEDKIRRRMWRIICQQLSIVTTQDATLARRFALWARGRYLWNASTKRWMVWGGGVWGDSSSNLGPVMAFFETVTAERKRYWELVGKDGQKGLNRLKTAALIKNVEILARDVDLGGSVKLEDFDQNPMHVNTPRGLWDMEAGKVIGKGPRLCTIKTACNPDLTAKGGLWGDFIQDVTGGDRKLARYLQRVAGKMLLGQSKDHTMFFIYGPTRSGKSVFVEALAHAFGGYARGVTKKVLSGSAHDEYVLSLRGVRMAVMEELGHTDVWDGATIKSLASEDTLTARPLWGKPVSFTPMHTMIVRGNDKPSIVGADSAVAERVQLVSFPNTVAKGDRDTALLEKLKRQGPEVLAWAMRGARLYLKEGLNPPEEVLANSQEYVMDSDVVDRFIRRYVVQEPGKSLSRYRMTKTFTRYLVKEGLKTWTASTIVHALRGKNLDIDYDDNRNMTFVNIDLVNEQELLR